jgi:hydroxymethylglutaryl-CoA synthase
MAGIVGYGVYVPRYRIKTSEIAHVWGEDRERIEKGLGIIEKAVPAMDEDSITLAVEAGKHALARAKITPEEIGAVYVGSESKVYAVKPNASVVAEALSITPNTTAADLEFACKAGTAGMQACMGLVDAGIIKYGMAIGSDTAQGRPGDALEYSAGAGAVAIIIGKGEESIAEIKLTYSFTTDTPDFWRRPKADYPSHGGRFTGEPAYFKHLLNAARGAMEKSSLEVEDFDFFVFHQPNAKFPLAAAKKLGIEKEKVMPSLVTPYIGNTYSASSLFGLAKVLDQCNGGERILLVSFGSGAGSDAFVIEVKDRIQDVKYLAPTVQEFIDKKTYISYVQYLKHRNKIKM